MGDEDQATRLLYHLLTLLHPTPAPPRSSSPPAGWRISQLSPTRLTALLLGASMAMMLSGSLTFIIGLIMMPWVLGFGMIFCLVGMVSSLSAGLGAFIAV